MSISILCLINPLEAALVSRKPTRFYNVTIVRRSIHATELKFGLPEVRHLERTSTRFQVDFFALRSSDRPTKYLENSYNLFRHSLPKLRFQKCSRKNLEKHKCSVEAENLLSYSVGQADSAYPLFSRIQYGSWTDPKTNHLGSFCYRPHQTQM